MEDFAMAKNKETNENNKRISFKDSIKTRLIGIMMLVAAVPLIIAVIISYNTSTKNAKEQALELLEAQADVVEQEFSSVVAQNVVALQTFASSHSAIHYVTAYGQDYLSVTDEQILKEMDEINDHINDGNSSLSLCNINGDQLLRADRKEGGNLADRDYFQQCVSTKKPVVSNIIVSKSTGNRVANIIVPIFDEDGTTVIGTIMRSYNLGVLHEFLLKHVSDGYIVDRDGTLAAHAQFEISAEDEPIVMSGAEFVVATEGSGMTEANYSGALTYTAWVKEPVSGYAVTVSRTDADIMAAARRAATMVVFIGVILVIIAAVISFLMAKSFTDPVIAVDKSLSALADGRFKTVDKFDQRKDEFGAISVATNTVISKLDQIVSYIKSSAKDLGASSEELSDMANQISQTAEDVSNAVQEIASGATQQADEIQDATENVGHIGEAVNGVKQSTEHLSDLADKMKQASEVSSKSLASLQTSSSEMTGKIDDISTTIQSTQNAVNNISEKVEGITSIATQTNLLSLNASIEAARAGEAGKGFAVVAEEIGKLAEDSKAMADDIRKEMDVLLEQSKAAVVAAEDVKQGNNDQQIALGETLEAVNGMISDIDSTVGGVQDISQGAETCDNSKNAVVDTMSALSAISEENAASSEETGASMEELSATVTTLAGAANNLKEIAEKLNEEMKFFKD
jgi:methyl-accepting chemotaxis protein